MVNSFRARVGGAVAAAASVIMGTSAPLRAGVGSLYTVECYRPDGTLRWVERVSNLVVNQGLTDLITAKFVSAPGSVAHYVGLKSSGTVAAADTMASHGGWAENTNYTEANRQTLTLGSVTNGAVDNSASKATFSINATTTVTGAFVSTNNTKSGTTGNLYGAVDFTNSRSVFNGDQILVTVNLSAVAV